MEIQAEDGGGVKHGRRRGGGEKIESPGGLPSSSGVANGWGDEPKGTIEAPDPVQSDDSVQIVREHDETSEAAEQLAATVADAPRNAARRVATLKELEREKGVGAGGLLVGASRAEGINLHILTSALYPQESLVEPDEVLDWDLTLQKITQEMGEEKAEETEDGKNGPLSPGRKP